MTTPGGTIHRHGPWGLTPEGAAIHAGERTAVIADVHLGYDWARAAAGDCVPAHSLADTVARLDLVLARAPIATLVVAGDLVEPHRPCRRTLADVRRLQDWLASRGVALLAIEGNHDRGLSPRMPRSGADDRASAAEAARLPASVVVDGWTIAHGHGPIAGERTISGHFHPMLRAGCFAARCFLTGPDRIVLPAFSSDAAGCDVRTGPVPTDWVDAGLRCIAGAGSEMLDFGTLPTLRQARGPSR